MGSLHRSSIPSNCDAHIPFCKLKERRRCCIKGVPWPRAADWVLALGTGCCSGSVSGSGTTAFRLAPIRALGDKQRASIGLAWHERCACRNY